VLKKGGLPFQDHGNPSEEEDKEMSEEKTPLEVKEPGDHTKMK